MTTNTMNIKVGERVRVVCKRVDTRVSWVPEMDKAVGKDFIVGFVSTYGANLKGSGKNNDWYFPYQSLERVCKTEEVAVNCPLDWNKELVSRNGKRTYKKIGTRSDGKVIVEFSDNGRVYNRTMEEDGKHLNSSWDRQWDAINPGPKKIDFTRPLRTKIGHNKVRYVGTLKHRKTSFDRQNLVERTDGSIVFYVDDFGNSNYNDIENYSEDC